MAYKMQHKSTSGLKDDVDTVVGLGIGQFIMGIMSIVCALVSVELECYQYSLGVAMWTGTLFMGTGGVGYSLQSDISKKLVRDSFALSIVSSMAAGMLVAYGAVAAWADFTDGKDMQGGIDVTASVIGLAEFSLAVSSAVISSKLSVGLSKYSPLRTLTEYQTTKDRTILLIPMAEDDVPLIQLPDGYKVSKVFVKD